ncbi:hypothetical protein [Lacticaseibacillus paracasei]|uniref:hypothetical protein n=1 Tax=Lacticaseibacillus paracasei TaxID=1597 RepID=UPI0031FEC272
MPPYLLVCGRAGNENGWFLPFRCIMLPRSDLTLAAGAPRFSALAEEVFAIARWLNALRL